MIQWSGPSALPIAQLSEAIALRSLSVVELITDTLARIGSRNDELHAFCTVAGEQALTKAQVADADIARGQYRGPLHGIPYGAKDIYDSAGILTAAQSRMLADNIPARNAAAIDRLEAAGAILVGKCATAEFGTGGPSPGMLFQPARNPWGHEYYTGGSSTGSGAATGAGLVPFALGSDTGGSIRGPAAFCGAVGLKPTYGLVSRRGVFPLSWSLDHCGPLARCVEDAGIALAGMAGADPLDPASAMQDAEDYTARIGWDLSGLRIGYLRSWPAHDELCDPEVLAGLDQAAQQLAALGAHVKEISFPDEAIFLAVGRTILISEFYAVHRRTLLETPHLYEPPARERLMVGALASSSDYVDALRLRRTLSARINREIFQSFDAMITSCAVRPAWRFDELPDAPMHMLGLTTYAFNVTGHPAMAMPIGLSSGGLPMSIQIVGRYFDEATMLQIGHALEASFS